MVWMIGVQFPEDGGSFIFVATSRPALGSTQSPIPWVPEAFSVGMMMDVFSFTFNSLEQSPSREANSSTASQEIAHLL
jgi:hypothetical protein